MRERNAMTCTKAQVFLEEPKGPVLQVVKYHSGRECICGHYYFCTDLLVERKRQSIYLLVPITRGSFRSVYLFLPCSYSPMQVCFFDWLVVFLLFRKRYTLPSS